MRVVVDRHHTFLSLVDKAMNELKSWIDDKNAINYQNPFSVDFLSEKAISPRSDTLNQLKHLMELKQYFLQSALKYDTNTKTLNYDQSLTSLADVVLFLDEVLLPSTNEDEKLRFLRNLGRALGMRVVLAGTGATAANMITAPVTVTALNMFEGSRGRGSTEHYWMVIEFIYQHVNLSLPRSLNAPESYMERPWFVLLLEKMSESTKSGTGHDIVKALGNMIWLQKRFAEESMLIWLCGPWLESDDRIPTSPFLLKPADLIRGHLFEPAFVLRRKKNSNNEEYPYFGKGFCVKKSVMGRFRMEVNHIFDDMKFWWCCNATKLSLLSNKEDESRIIKEGRTLDFARVKYCLSHCVQICLAKEPLMAVCLSSITVDNFQESYSKLLSQKTLSPQQQTAVKVVDNELNEYAMFAALQLACRCSKQFMQTNKVKDMVEKLSALLRIIPEDTNMEHNTITTSATTIIYYGIDDTTEGINTKDEIKKVFEETKMPWLIPACSKDKLSKAFDKCKGMFTGDYWNIAGLVPERDGNNNSFSLRIDAAKVYQWDDNISLEWSFVFQCQSTNHYTSASFTQGVHDLNAGKCNNNFLEKDDDDDYHAMHIAVSSVHEYSQVRVWLTCKKKLRIVLVVGCG